MTQPATVVVRVNDVQALRALDGLSRRFADMGRRMQTVGLQLASLGGAISAPLGVAAASFAKMDTGLRTIQGVTGASAKEMQRLRDAASQMSDDISPRTAVAEMEELARAGRDVSDILETIGAVATLRKIEPALGLGEASKQIDGILQGFQLQAAEANRVVDLLAGTANASKASIQDIGQAFSISAATAKSADQSIERLAASVAVLTNNNYTGEKSGTALRGILATLGKESKRNKLKELLGVDVLDAAGNFRDLGLVLKDLSAKLNSLPSGERAGILGQVFDTEQLNAANILIQNADAVERLTNEIAASDGSAAKLADTMTGGLEGSATRLKNALEDLSTSIGEALAPSLIKVSEGLKVAVKDLTAFVKANPEAVTALAALGGSLTVVGTSAIAAGYAFQFSAGVMSGMAEAGARLLTVLNSLSIANLRSAATAMIATTAYLALTAAKITAATAGLALLAAAGAIIVLGQAFVGLGAAIAAANFGPEFAKQSGVMQIILETLRKLTDGAVAGFRLLGTTALAAINRLASGAQSGLRVVAQILDPRNLLKGIATLARKMVEPFRNIFRGIAAAIGPLAEEAFRTVENIVSGAFQGIVQVASSALTFVGNLFQPLVQIIATAASQAAAPFIAAFRILGREAYAVTTGTIGFFTGLAAETTRIAGQLGAAFADTFRDVAPSIQLIVDALRAGNFQQAADLAGQSLKYGFERAIIELQIAWKEFVGFFAQQFDAAVAGIVERMRLAVAEMSNALKPIVQAVTLIATGGDAGAAAQAGKNLQAQTAAIVKSLNQTEAAIAKASQRTANQAERDIANLRGQIDDLRAALNRERFETLLPGVISDVTTGAKGFGAAMQESLAPLGGILEGWGWQVGDTIAQAAAEAESLFTSQVFAGASKQVIDLNRDAIGNQSLDIARKQLETLKGIEEGVGDLELGFG